MPRDLFRAPSVRAVELSLHTLYGFTFDSCRLAAADAADRRSLRAFGRYAWRVKD